MLGKKYVKKARPTVTVIVDQVRGHFVNFHEVGYPNPREMPVEEFNFAYEELTDQPIKNEAGIRNQLQAALENMYMLGGMPKPEPNYDSYLKRMIEAVMIEVKKSV
jgi:hypothetical protein